MGDSLPNFAEMGSPEYSGLYDTAQGFSGSSTLQDVQLGSPVLLDSSLGPNEEFTVTDFLNMDLGNGKGDSLVTMGAGPAQSLSGISNPPFASAAQSTPTPNVADPSPTSGMGLTALSKFGASIAALWAGPAKYQAGAQQVVTTPAGATLVPGAASGTNVLLLLIVVGALVLLLARSE